MTLEEGMQYIECFVTEVRQWEMNFCKNFRKLRKLFGLTKVQMAKNCGISLYQLNLIEQNIVLSGLSGCVLDTIDKFYGISPLDMAEKDVCEILKNKINTV